MTATEHIDVGWVSGFRVTHQALCSNTTHFFNECLTASLVGYAPLPQG